MTGGQLVSVDCLSQLVPDIMSKLGESFDLTLSHSLPACLLMDEWRWQEVKEMGGSPRFCFCADEPLIPFNKLSFLLCLFNQKLHTHNHTSWWHTALTNRPSVHSLILTIGRRRQSCRLYSAWRLVALQEGSISHSYLLKLNELNN